RLLLDRQAKTLPPFAGFCITSLQGPRSGIAFPFPALLILAVSCLGNRPWLPNRWQGLVKPEQATPSRYGFGDVMVSASRSRFSARCLPHFNFARIEVPVITVPRHVSQLCHLLEIQRIRVDRPGEENTARGGLPILRLFIPHLDQPLGRPGGGEFGIFVDR